MNSISPEVAQPCLSKASHLEIMNAYKRGLAAAKASIDTNCPIHVEITTGAQLTPEDSAYCSGWNSLAFSEENLELLRDVGFDAPIHLADLPA